MKPKCIWAEGAGDDPNNPPECYRNGKRHGRWQLVEDWRDKSHRWVRTGRYVNGKKHGEWHEEHQQHPDVLDGGTSVRTGPYVYGLKQGVWQEKDHCYFPASVLVSAGMMVRGKRHGQWECITYDMPTQTNPDKFPTAITGNIGLFHVCRELSRRGFNVVPTLGNAPDVDLLVYKGAVSCTVQVKTSIQGIAIKLAETKQQDDAAIAKCKKDAEAKCRSADFWVFVRIHRFDGLAIENAPISVRICSGDEIHLIDDQKAKTAYSCWFSVWDGVGKWVTQETVDKWARRENRWDLIAAALK